MNKLTNNSAKAIIELTSSIADLNDYSEFPLVLESVLNRYFHIDWTSLFYSSGKSDHTNITTNPFLPFNWDELWYEIAEYDNLKQYTLTLNPGDVCIHDEIRNPYNEEENYCLEFTKKHTDTVQFMTLPTINESGSFFAFGFYRTEENKPFLNNDKNFIKQISPLIIYASRNMMLFHKYDLKVVALNKLIESEQLKPVVFNKDLFPIELPKTTMTFLRKMFGAPYLNSLPQQIMDWINNTVAPTGKLQPYTGPWKLTLHLPKSDLNCYAYAIYSRSKKLVLLIKFEEHGQTEDFSILKNFGVTKREIEVLEYLPLGYTNKQIAIAMGIQEVSVKKHLRNVAKKFNVTGKTAIMYQAIQHKKDLLSLSLS